MHKHLKKRNKLPTSTHLPKQFTVSQFVVVINLLIQQTLILLVDTNPVTLGVFVEQTTLCCHIQCIGKDCKLSKLTQIDFEKFLQILSLDFDCKCLVALCCHVHLSKGSSSKSLLFKGVVNLVDWFSQFALNDLNCRVSRKGWNIIL